MMPEAEKEKPTMVTSEAITTRRALHINKTIVRRFSRANLPPVRQTFESELGCQLSKADHRNDVRGNCCFHQSKSRKSFKVNIETGLWFCFGCGFGGDMVSFIQRRHGLGFVEAADYLGALQDVSDADRHAVAQKASEHKQKQAEEARLRRLAHDERIELRDEIHVTARIQRETSAQLSELLQGAAPTYENEVEDCCAVLALALGDLRDCEASYMAASGMEYVG